MSLNGTRPNSPLVRANAPRASAKDEILGKVRRAIGDHSPVRDLEYSAIPRGYRRSGASGREEVLALLTDRLTDYDTGVYHCAAAGIADTVAAIMAKRGKTSLLRPDHLPEEWLPSQYRFPLVNGLPYEEVDLGEGVITGCAAAIAFTGTIILSHTPGDARRALTLIPDYHLCVVFANQVVETVPEGIARLKGLESSPVTTISGPSATADIEMNRVKGVHGPRFLDVILVD
jgi:L-lactate dehydrogenase complex protein LldG